ncbi:MAG: biopolymer transporter ExbD [Pseudomonadota bacterium]
MRSHSSKQTEDATIDLTPMLDVVFIMLIFFIVTATFVKEAGIDVTKADARTAELANRASIFIAINANNEVYIQRNKVDINQVAATVERLHAENPKGSIVIQPDAKSSVNIYAKVQDQVKAAGVETIILATTPI